MSDPAPPIESRVPDWLNRHVIDVGRRDAHLLRYLDDLRVQESGNPRASGATAIARTVVPSRFRPALKTRLTHLRMVGTRLQARRMLASGRAIRLHLGCGEIHLAAWANVDLVGAGAADFLWDLRQPLPFPDGSVHAIFHEHLLEHLSYWDGVGLFLECRRLLAAGGILRLGVPDFGRYARDYVTRSGFIEYVRGGRPTPLLALAEIAYCYQHVSIWDAETLVSLFEESGFVSVSVRQSGESRLDPAPDTPYRKPETLYVEGVGPETADPGPAAAHGDPQKFAVAKEMHQ